MKLTGGEGCSRTTAPCRVSAPSRAGSLLRSNVSDEQHGADADCEGAEDDQQARRPDAEAREHGHGERHGDHDTGGVQRVGDPAVALRRALGLDATPDTRPEVEHIVRETTGLDQLLFIAALNPPRPPGSE